MSEAKFQADFFSHYKHHDVSDHPDDPALLWEPSALDYCGIGAVLDPSLAANGETGSLDSTMGSVSITYNITRSFDYLGMLGVPGGTLKVCMRQLWSCIRQVPLTNARPY